MKKTLKKPKKIFPRAGFLTGLGSTMNISGNYYNFKNILSQTPTSDWEAVENDFAVVGEDIRSVVKANPVKR